MALDLITGHQGVAHISARQISDINKAVMNGYGDDTVVRMTGAELTQDGLTIEISTGYWRTNGFDVEVSEEETVYIDPSSVGTSRIDNVYVELLQNIPTGSQRAEIVTVQGEEADSPIAPEDPTAPVLNTDILLEVVKLAQVTVTEGAMVLNDMTVAYDLVTPEELEAVEDKADAAQQMIAPIEEGPNASKAYAKDAQFIYNGLLHIAKSAIAQNDTLVEDGNMELAPVVADQLTSLKASLNGIVLASSSTSGTQGQKVASLLSAFNALTIYQKCKCVILQYSEDNVVLNAYSPYSKFGRFVSDYTDTSNSTTGNVYIDLGLSTFFYVGRNSTGTYTYIDYTSGSNSQRFELIMI